MASLTENNAVRWKIRQGGLPKYNADKTLVNRRILTYREKICIFVPLSFHLSGCCFCRLFGSMDIVHIM